MKVSRLIPFMMLLALVFSCKPKVPGKYLQPDEFEDILYDLHLASAMADNSSGDDGVYSYNARLYRQAVLSKYGITQAEFDSSLVYYTRHSDRLHSVYEGLAKRFEEEAMALGASASDIQRYGDMKSSRDTSNLWTGEKHAMFMPVAPYNVMPFAIEADSSYHKGDRLIFSFNCNFIDRGGRKSGVALLAVQFSNDSVASTTVRMSSRPNSNYSLTVSDLRGDGIKAVRGFIYLDERKDDEKGSCLMFVSDIRLVRMRGSSMPVSNVKRADNIVRCDSAPRPADVGGRQLPVMNMTARPVKMSEIKPSDNKRKDK